MKKRKRRPNWPYRLAWLGIGGAVLLYIVGQTIVGGLTFAHRAHGTDWSLALVSSLLDATIAVWFVAVGASIGSFLNVVAYRLPLKRSLGGHSSCPYCRTPIQSSDNVPVLGWVKLRGRCRSCRLPISVQYPLIELGVGCVFFVVYFSEFLFSGGNLPGVQGNPLGVGGMMRISVSSELVLRLAIYLFALSGLIGAALIALRYRSVPMYVYVWCLVPATLATIVNPDIVVVGWRSVQPAGWIEARLDGLVSVLFGVAAGIALARLLAPRVYPGFDQTLMSPDKVTAGARQFLGAMGVAGGIVGWQSVVPLGCVVLAVAAFGRICIRRFAKTGEFDERNWNDLTVWVWLGLLVFRAHWSGLFLLASPFENWSPVVVHVSGALVLALVTMLVFRADANRFSVDHSLETEDSPDEEVGDDFEQQASADALQDPTTADGQTSSPATSGEKNEKDNV